MYRSIQVTDAYRLDRMNEHGPIGSNKRNEGTLSALLKNGDTFKAPFGGFIEGENLIGLRRVKLLHVRFLCEDEDAMTPSYQIPKDHYLVGIYLEKKLYVLLVGGQPQHHFYKNAEIETNNKVCRLF
ncbi:hypothetical protein OH456_06790 [Vibrio sp. La 4.2.2]|uniref:hypothetical protein n=1 Tax=Vibrio sp. La 4.2.2 TaxID=2998830 RepID=UPI0022CDE56B|nr:hypothetical protein [Vibrio sp. La 4.2.2]MDA0107842.1 hypothetical protein [Vibrio sp. La 4.2.2]